MVKNKDQPSSAIAKITHHISQFQRSVAASNSAASHPSLWLPLLYARPSKGEDVCLSSPQPEKVVHSWSENATEYQPQQARPMTIISDFLDRVLAKLDNAVAPTEVTNRTWPSCCTASESMHASS